MRFDLNLGLIVIVKFCILFGPNLLLLGGDARHQAVREAQEQATRRLKLPS